MVADAPVTVEVDSVVPKPGEESGRRPSRSATAERPLRRAQSEKPSSQGLRGSPLSARNDWSIRRPDTHQLGGAFTLFGPPPRTPRTEKRSPPGAGAKLATYERNVEFVKQREARLESARKERADQEISQLAAPSLTETSRKLVTSGYSPPWEGKRSFSASCRSQKVMKAAAESKAQEEAEHTFKPSINERSKAIFRHMINTGQPWHDRVHAGDRPGKPPGTKALTPRCEQHPFSPQISKKAQQLRRDGDVSERSLSRKRPGP
ncbi:unnamed protein product [Durusdinium trenchii]|uniref:TPX2 C-terminal domain-containing protein n=1 Tax=Durusdinium trenchii TaxID=1381693 RepID=A0ABP0H6A5_9DINO